jgi:hypothetical protein
MARRQLHYSRVEEARAKHVRCSKDLDLLQPFKDAQERAKDNALLTAELEALMNVVRANRAKYERWGMNTNEVDIKIWRQGVLCDLAHSVHSELAALVWKHSSQDEKIQVAASYAYGYGLQETLFMKEDTR